MERQELLKLSDNFFENSQRLLRYAVCTLKHHAYAVYHLLSLFFDYYCSSFSGCLWVPCFSYLAGNDRNVALL